MALATAATISLTSCSSSGSDTDDHVTHYDRVQSVNVSHWASDDTLSFAINVTEQPQVRTPLLRQYDYHTFCSLRTTSDCRLTSLPLMLILQQVDDQGAVIRNLLRTEVNPVVRDETGRHLGSSWGSLYQYEAELPDARMRFDDAGNYRILLYPVTGSAAAIQGVASVGLSLQK